MAEAAGDSPDLERLRGIVAPEVLHAADVASRMLREAGVPHALAGGLAVGAHGYPRTTDDVDFLVGDEAFVIHAGGLVTLKVPVIAVGNVRVDLVSIEESKGEAGALRPAMMAPSAGDRIPIVPMTTLVFMKLKAGRQRDLADLVELLKRGRVDTDAVDHYLGQHAPAVVRQWDAVKETAAKDER
jgi:hypothetical protein